MTRFHTVLENAIKNSTSLKRIRLRVDPSYCEGGEIKKFDGYEGFILAENKTKVKVLIEGSQGTIIIVPREMVQDECEPTPLDKLKLIALSQLKLANEDATLIKLTSANTPEAIEQILKEYGCQDCDILNLYKTAYFN